MQFQVGYTTSPVLKLHRTFQERLINIMAMGFLPKNIKFIKKLWMVNKVTVISMHVFNEQRNTIMFKECGIIYLYYPRKNNLP